MMCIITVLYFQSILILSAMPFSARNNIGLI
jgi:hypothetical protein